MLKLDNINLIRIVVSFGNWYLFYYFESKPCHLNLKKSVLWVLGLKKASTFDLFHKSIFSFFFIPSEINFTHPFYPILIPSTSYVKKRSYSTGVPIGPKNLKKIIWTRICKKIFLIEEKKYLYFCTGCPKSDLRGG